MNPKSSLSKTLLYTGKHTNLDTKISHFHFNESTHEVNNHIKPHANMKNYLQIVGLTDAQQIQSLKKYYNIDLLILEDIFHVHQRTKIEVKENYLFGVFHVQYLEQDIIKNDYLSLLLFEDTLITFHETKPHYLEDIEKTIANSEDIKNNPIDYLFYHILDKITDLHIDVFKHLDLSANAFEEEILESQNINQETFYLLRKQLLMIKNNVSPTLEQIEKLLSKTTKLLHNETMAYHLDLRDHLKRLDHNINQSRELMRNLLDLHINNQSNKMNRIMTTLTLFSAIFIPLSFLTGFFGMNFIYFEVLAYKHSLIIFVGICIFLSFFMVILFKKMKWFN